MQTSTVPATTATLDVPGAHLHHELRGTGPLVVLVGAPMDAAAFAPLADLLATDHTVLTTDPRGINRSTVADPGADSTPQLRADDLARLITDVDAGPAAVLGSSGGAVSVLALVEHRPDLVHTAVVHEPPLDELVEDRAALRAQTDDIIETYAAGDPLGAWKKFLRTANIDMPAEVVPAMVVRDPQAVADERYQYLRMLGPTTRWRPDVAALRAARTRIVVAVRQDSAGELCDRTSRALAALLDVAPTMFPGGHIGFVDDPAAFARTLRSVLRGVGSGTAGLHPTVTGS